MNFRLSSSRPIWKALGAVKACRYVEEVQDSETTELNQLPVPGPAGKPRMSMRLVVALAIIAGILTGFDGAATWYEVEFLRVAEEANPLLQGVESIVGFTGAMVFRVVGGLALLLGVVYAAHRSAARGRSLMVVGLFVVCIFYALLDYYHWMILWNFRHLVP